MKRSFWRRDWFAVVVLTILFIGFSQSDAFQSLERMTYDLGARMASKPAQQDIAVIAIDDTSIENIGRWPWPRDVQAELIDRLTEAGASVIGLTILLSEAQQDPGLKRIREISDLYRSEMGIEPEAEPDESAQQTGDDDAPAEEETGPADTETAEDEEEPTPAEQLAAERLAILEAIGQQLDRAEQELDTDKALAASIEQAGNVIMAMQMRPGEPLGKPDKALPNYVLREQIPDANVGTGPGGLALPPQTTAVIPPIATLGEPAAGIGHIVSFLDVDGALRSEPLVLSYYGQYFPSLALQVAAASLNLTPEDMRITLGDRVELGNLVIDTDGSLTMQTFFYSGAGDKPAFPTDSFYDVYSGKIDPAKYEDRIVLIGATAFGLGSSLTTPVDGSMEPVQVLAHTVASILNEDFFIQPAWAGQARWLAFLFIVLYLALALPRLSAGQGAILSTLVLVLIVGSELGMMTGKGLWVPLMLPASLLFTGHLLLTTKRFLLTEESKEKSEKESAESNRMLGLAFQQQGQLDMAFEKFRRAPLDEELMDLLYNLALDFERKRQFNKAASVYEYMAKFDANFRDIQQRSKRATQAQDTMIFGSSPLGGGGGEATLVADGDEFEKPMLGRYQVEKELGRGAMGIVYQGRDPKINRVVAIKTLSLSDEFEADELDDIKDRFFREAEAAGRLNHPNIVTVYDAGEEHDLAYIAMEFLNGHDLVRYTKPDKLMPLEQVLTIVERCADALGYAHEQQIVHRDIKPANIMYDPDVSSIKITDFGIARVSNASRTKTGMVVGTPSYMSPEQVKGKKVDGRSDIFSLGVMMYQMISGELPFQADNPTNIMYQIATEPHPDITETRPKIRKTAPWVAVVINRALEKDPEKRYQKGSDMAADIRKVLDKMKQSSSGDAPQE
jgi:CHASE2 domain-containing sensor protein/tRNA A-37 threonylcarbamoyl transferase component Bud32